MPATQQNQVTIGGVTIKTVATPDTDVAETLVIIKKEDRKNLTTEKLQELFDRVTKKQHVVFELQAQTMQSITDLQETYDLGNALDNVQTHFKRYDMLHVFMIVKPIVDANGVQTGGLEMT